MLSGILLNHHIIQGMFCDKLKWKVIRRKSAQITPITESNLAFTNDFTNMNRITILHNDSAFLKTLLNS